jgi:hypothetical protein
MHVLILANELQITDSKYSTVKEKVVGKTFAMKPDIDLAMSNIWCSFKNKSKSLDNHRQSIEKTIKKCESVNLRSAIQAIDNCNLVLHFLEKLPSLKNEALDSLMVMTSAVTMESKLNGQLISLLRNLFASPHAVVFAAYLKREDETQDNNLEFLERFAARYFDGNIEKIPSLEAILNFVESGWIEIDLVHAQALALTTNVMPEKANLKQVFLRDIWSLNDQQVFEIAKSYIHEVNAGLITRVQLLAKVFASLMFISKHQVIAQTPTEILEQFLKAIEKLSLEDKFSESDIVNWDPQIVFYGQTGAEIVKFIEALNTARDIYIERRYQERLGSLFNEFDSDYEKFLQRMRGNRDEDHFDYEHKPVFARFDSKDFTDVILKKNAQDLRSFSQMLNQRYFRVVNIADFLKDEGIFLLKLASRLKEKLPSVAPGLKRIVIGRVIEQLEQASIKLCPQLASEEKAIDR